MEFDKIVAVSGMPGLYHVIGQRPNGLILEQLGNESKKFATSARQKVSVLADIAMFTEDEDVKLSKILQAAKALEEKGELIPDKKEDNPAVIKAFAKVLPGYSKEKVYISDMKKLFGWYHELKAYLDFDKLDEKTEEKSDIAETTGKTKDAKIKKVSNTGNTKVKTKTGVTKQSKNSVPRKSS